MAPGTICAAPEGYDTPVLRHVSGGILIMCVGRDKVPLWWDGHKGEWRQVDFSYDAVTD